MKKTLVTISNRFLIDLLHLPDDVEVESIMKNKDTLLNGLLTMTLIGDGLPSFTEIRTDKKPISQSEIIYTKTITNEIKKVGE